MMGVDNNRKIHSADDLSELVQEYGFLPFFKNEIPGFSVEEHTPPSLWFSDVQDGPWEWKGPVIRSGGCVYGKLFLKKAGFVSRDWFPDFANYRRDGYDFDARYDDGLASYKDKSVYDAIAEHGSLLTKEVKELCNYCKNGNKGFETVITRLQMQGYIMIADFEYQKDRYGHPYGWGIARYSTPEICFGDGFIRTGYREMPDASREKIVRHLSCLLPSTNKREIVRIVE